MPVKLPAAERASYMELSQQLMSQDMKLPRGGKAKIDSDRTIRLKEIMGSSKTPEEALVKRCSHFTLEDLGKSRENASQDCDAIVQVRMSQYKDCLAEFRTNLKHATLLKRECEDKDVHFEAWKRIVSSNAYGDLETSDVLLKMINAANEEYSVQHEKIFYRDPSSPEEVKAVNAQEGNNKAPRVPKTKATQKKRQKREDSDGLSDSSQLKDEKVKELRTLTGHLRNLAKELVSRIRALRFFKAVRAVQLWQSELPAGHGIPEPPVCSKCKTVARDPESIFILGVCGHTACAKCLASPERGGECVTVGCDASALDYQTHKAAELGQEDEKTRVGRHYGKKLEEVIDLIKNRISDDDQVLLFVQFDDLMEKVSTALKYHRIKHYAITESSRRHASAMMDSFQTDQDGDKRKVLILNLADESAAGA